MSSFSKYVGNGAQTVFAVNQPMPPYSALEVSLDGLVETSGFTYNRTNATVTFAVAPADGVVVKLSRVTQVEPLHKFATGAAFTARNVDTNFTQESYRVEELQDNVVGVKELEASVLQASEDAEAALAQLLASSTDYIQVGTFAAGYASLQTVQQTLLHSDGHRYGWTGSFPKTVPAGSTPTPLGAGGWVDRSDVTLRGDLGVNGSTINGFKRNELSSVARGFLERFTSDEIKVKDFGAAADGSVHQLAERFPSLLAAQVAFPFVTSLTQSIDWAAAQAATNLAITKAQSLIVDGSATEITYKTGAYASIEFDSGVYNFGGDSVIIPSQTLDTNLEFRSNSGSAIVGTGTLFNFNGGGRKNRFKNLVFGLCTTAIRLDTSNDNESMLVIDGCESHGCDIFLDTVSYASSRSTMVHIKDSACGDTRVFVKHYTDHMRIDNCWMYAKKDSYDAMLYLSGDGVVTIDSSFFIPHGQQIPVVSDSRFIDFVSDPAQSTPNDRSIKQLKVVNCRASLESARGFIWTFDGNAQKPDGTNRVSSVVVEDSYVGCTGGYPVVDYRLGYPGSVILRNCRGFACPKIVAVAATNPTAPIPSAPGALTYHAIIIDEATRLAQSNHNNSSSLIDPALQPFCYDTTSQTSKYKRSIPKNIDYRLPTVAAPGAGANRVKVSIPVFFDSAPSVANRDILSFMLVTVSDGGAAAAGDTGFRATSVSLVSVVGGSDGGTKKRIVTTVLQDAKGGLSGFTDVSANPTVFWGTADTGVVDVSKTSTSGIEDFITAVWVSTDPATSWAYIIPIAGMRENQQDKMQFGVW